MPLKQVDKEYIYAMVEATKCGGFCLLTFDLGERGNMTYTCNAVRKDMIRALRELIGHLEVSNGDASTDGNR